MRVILLDTAKTHIDDIYVYCHEQWGAAQADTYLDGLYEMFERVASRAAPWRSVPSDFEMPVESWFVGYGSHFIYWRVFDASELGIFAVLHQSTDLGNRLREVMGD